MSAIDELRGESLAGRWVWLFPATYLVHIGEEYWGGFPAWASGFGVWELTPAEFLELNGIAWALMTVGVILALRLAPLRWLLISFGAVVLLNGIAHTLASLVTWSYSPGLFSGLLLWIPLGAYALRRAWRTRKRRTFWRAILAGVVMHGAVTLLAFGGGR